jgi:hypothetical protein
LPAYCAAPKKGRLFTKEKQNTQGKVSFGEEAGRRGEFSTEKHKQIETTEKHEQTYTSN